MSNPIQFLDHGPLPATFGAPAVMLLPLTTIASQTATGTQGQFVWDQNFLYVCSDQNFWKRAQLDDGAFFYPDAAALAMSSLAPVTS